MRRRRVVVTDYTFPSLDLERAVAGRHQATFDAFQCRSEEEVVSALTGTDVAVVQFAPITKKALQKMSSGSAIIRYGTGFDNIDLAAAKENHIAVGYVPDYCVDEVADHTAAMILAALRKLAQLESSLRRGQWNAAAMAQPLKAFSETTVGFFGFGRIGRAVLTRLRPFGFRFLVADLVMTAPEASDLGTVLTDQETLLAQADVLSLHAPATPATEHFINGDSLSLMKRSAIVVNTARGKLIDEQALVQALHAGTIGGAALDVFESEPLPIDSPLRDAPNLIISPHAAWYSDIAVARLQSLVAQDLDRLLSGAGPRCPVPGSLTAKAESS